MTKEDVNKFACSKNIILSENELDFLYNFIKKNYEALYANPNIDFSRYKHYFSNENYEKILSLIKDYKIKYANFFY